MEKINSNLIVSCSCVFFSTYAFFPIMCFIKGHRVVLNQVILSLMSTNIYDIKLVPLDTFKTYLFDVMMFYPFL